MKTNLSNVCLLMLAAGRSSRMGEPKALLDVHGVPLIRWQIARFKQAGGASVCVVVSPTPDGTAIISSVSDTPEAEGVVFITNPDPDRGVFSSIMTGLSQILSESAECRSIFVQPVDVPLAGAQALNQIASAHTDNTRCVVPLWNGRGGHPLWLARFWADHLLASVPENQWSTQRMDQRVRDLGSLYKVYCSVQDECVALNLNTPQDYDRFITTRAPCL